MSNHMFSMDNRLKNCNNKYKVLAVSIKCLVDVFKGKDNLNVIKNKLPPDAKIVGTRLNSKFSTIEFVIESNSYKSVKAGMPIPFADDLISQSKE